jgi:hypothetical protein
MVSRHHVGLYVQLYLSCGWGGRMVTLCLVHCSTRQKVAGTRPDESAELNLPAAVGSRVYLACNRNDYYKQKNMFLWCKAAVGA